MIRVVLVAVLLGLSLPAQGARTYRAFVEERNVMVPMRDGVKLAVDVYRPDAEGEFPIIMQRSPYGTDYPQLAVEAKRYARHGYAVLNVDCRGKFDSEGEWYPLKYEAQDGHDCIEWAGTRSWSNGHVGMIGGSYVGWVQMLAAPEGSRYLKALVPQVTPPDPFLNLPYQHGAFLPQSVYWARMTAGRELDFAPAADATWTEVYSHRPILGMDNRSGANIDFFDDWVSHNTFDDYWVSMSYQHRYAEMDVPALHMTGWYDDDQVGGTMNYVGLRAGAKTEAARRGQRLLIGPWGHALNSSNRMGELSFGGDAVIPMEKVVLRWFDYWLKGIDNGVDDDEPVRIFTMGRNQWRDAEDWPLPETEFTRFYLHPGGGLSREMPGDASSSRFAYDPADPTPFVTEESSNQIGGPDDYSEVHETRKDLALFETEPLPAPLEATGPLVVKLWASTSAPDTDWTAMVCDVWPDGTAVRIQDGILRASLRASLSEQVLLEPGRVYDYTIDCWATSYVFEKGHRIRVAIASAAFPKFYPNPNTGNLDPRATEVQVAQQAVHHSAEHPSHLLLPVIPAK